MATLAVTHQLPPLPYSVAALSPCIEARTMSLHHGKHHAGYVKALNLALEQAPELMDETPEWLLLNLARVPESIRTKVRQNAGGHVNHTFFWHSMTPASDGAPTGHLAGAIDDAFGSFEKFKSEFEEAGNGVFGSGWVWLTASTSGALDLQVAVTSGHHNPLMDRRYPLLVNDVWEHSYYLQHENRRDEYLHGWWSVVNWAEVERRFAAR